MRVGEVCVSAGFGTDAEPRALVARCRARAVPVTVVARGDSWSRGGVTVHVLSPCRDVTPPTDNEASIVAHVTVAGPGGALTALVPGDVGGAPLRAPAED